jgi:hypothetical protein
MEMVGGAAAPAIFRRLLLPSFPHRACFLCRYRHSLIAEARASSPKFTHKQAGSRSAQRTSKGGGQGATCIHVQTKNLRISWYHHNTTV